MARIFITGSSDGLGSLAAQALVKKKHRVVLHARNAARAEAAKAACPGAESVLIADISSMAETKQLAEDLNKQGPFDVIIHNAGLYRGPFRKSADGFSSTFAVNTLAPYILTCLVQKPKRLVFVTSDLHRRGKPGFHDLTWAERGEQYWNDMQAYCDSKLHDVLLSFAFARKWPDVPSNVLDPGWVKTKMGGPSAPDDIQMSVKMYTDLAEGEGNATGVTGKYFCDTKVAEPESVANDLNSQEQLLKDLERISGISFPG